MENIFFEARSSLISSITQRQTNYTVMFLTVGLIYLSIINIFKYSTVWQILLSVIIQAIFGMIFIYIGGRFIFIGQLHRAINISSPYEYHRWCLDNKIIGDLQYTINSMMTYTEYILDILIDSEKDHPNLNINKKLKKQKQKRPILIKILANISKPYRESIFNLRYNQLKINYFGTIALVSIHFFHFIIFGEP